MLVDLDDVIDVRDDGTGMMTREAWDIIQSLGGYAAGVTVDDRCTRLREGRIPGDVDGREIMEELTEGGHVGSMDTRPTVA